MPLFLVEGLKPRLGGSLRDRKVAVLGLTFKRDSDDVRDSLSYKLDPAAGARAGPRRAPRPARAGRVRAAGRCARGADAVVIATNHSAFEGLLARVPAGALLVDPWNVTGLGHVFGAAPTERATPSDAACS